MEFRAAWVIRISVLTALCLWLAVGYVTLTTQGWSWRSMGSVGFFVLFFAGFSAYYWSLRYIVDEHGVTYSGGTERTHFPWEDILHVSTSAVPLGGYWVSTRRGGFVLSNFVGRRDQLLEVIVARAGLFPDATT